MTNGPIDFYDVDVSYDRVSNVDVVEDNVSSGWDVDSTDTSTVSGDFGQTMGRGVLSRPATATAGVGNSRGYAGYAFDDAGVLHHVRHRVSSPTDGRWLRRDPIGYVDGASLYEYVASRAIAARDPMGMRDTPVACVPYAQLNSEGMVKMGGGCGGFKILQGNGRHPPPHVCASKPDMRYLGDCLGCCAYTEPSYDSPWGAACAQHCYDRFGDVPEPDDPPPSSDECLNPLISEPDISTCDRAYGSCDCLYGANVACMCKCMGNDPWSDFVRACLQCMHRVPGKPWDAAHFDCWYRANQFYEAPLWKLWGCVATCRSWQQTFCQGSCDPPP